LGKKAENVRRKETEIGNEQQNGQKASPREKKEDIFPSREKKIPHAIR